MDTLPALSLHTALMTDTLVADELEKVLGMLGSWPHVPFAVATACLGSNKPSKAQEVKHEELGSEHYDGMDPRTR